MEARDPLPSVRWARAAVFGVAPFDPGSVRKDADSATASNGTRRRGTTFRTPSGAPESGVQPHRLGTGAVPGAGRITDMGRPQAFDRGGTRPTNSRNTDARYRSGVFGTSDGLT